jgi:AcrR family transcriptional regulator
MRKLARALGVEAMSLYNHVANKDDLKDGIVDLVVSEIDLPSTAADWETAIREYAISAHEALLRHPWACTLVMSPTTVRTVRTPRLRYMEWLLRQLHEAGFSPELASPPHSGGDDDLIQYRTSPSAMRSTAPPFASMTRREAVLRSSHVRRSVVMPRLRQKLIAAASMRLP